ncbi:MAG: four helix bundle protein [Hymenobacter sp.]
MGWWVGGLADWRIGGFHHINLAALSIIHQPANPLLHQSANPPIHYFTNPPTHQSTKWKLRLLKKCGSARKAAALRVVRLHRALPHTDEARVIGRQLLRSATSVGANYRAACRGRSRAEYFAKLCICIEEADETLYWLELLMEAGIMAYERLAPIHEEFDKITAVLASSRKTMRE